MGGVNPSLKHLTVFISLLSRKAELGGGGSMK